MSETKYNWVSTGPGGCDSHCIEHPCGPCARQFDPSIRQPVPQPTPSMLIASADYMPKWDQNISEDLYHADRTSVGSSQIRRVLESPAAFYYDYYVRANEPEEPEEDHFRLGRIIHKAVLEGPKFRDMFEVEPVFTGYTAKGELSTSASCKEVKEKRNAWLNSRPSGNIIVTAEERDMIVGVAQAIMAHPQGPNLIKGGLPEVAGYYRDPETGILCRIKPDFIRVDGTSMIDLKSAKSSHKYLFRNQAAQHRYDIQLFMYSEGARIINGHRPEIITHMVVEKKPPYEPAIYFYEAHQLEQAESDYRTALRKLKRCIDEDKWPYRQQQIEQAPPPPAWFINQIVEEENV